MGMDLRIVVDQTPALAAPGQTRNRVLGDVARAMLSNRKALAGGVLLLLFVLIAVFAPLIAPYPPQEDLFLQILPPSRAHLLGTTGNGQDIFSQLVWGTR